MMNRIAKAFREFFEDEHGSLSMTRLLCFMSFFPASWMSMKIENENALTIYVATYALSYLGSKGLDVMNQIRVRPTGPTNINVEQANVTTK